MFKKSVVILLVVLSVLSLSFAQESGVDVHPLVNERLAQDGQVSVIVLLKDSHVQGGRGVSDAAPGQGVREAKRAQVEGAKAAFFAGLPSEARVGRGVSGAEVSNNSVLVLQEYYTVPALALKVDAAGLEALKSDSAVAKVLPNLVRTIDDRGEISGGSTSDIGISLYQSAPLINSDDVANITVNGTNLTGQGEVVCVIDTGIDSSHLFFGPVIEASGILGGVYGGYDFVNNDSNATDDNSHGTHVSGIAVGNISPYFGTARNAEVVPVKVCNAGGSCSDSAILAGVDYCNNNITGTTVISGSLGGGSPLNSTTCSADPLFSTLEPLFTTSLSLGIIPVFASGNGGHTTGVDYPACSPQVVSVGSTTKADAISSFTDRGGDRFDIYAPGEPIESSVPFFNLVQNKSGTSMATPHVSGAIAVFQENERVQGRSRLNLSQIRVLLQQTGKPIAPNNSRIDILNVILKRNLNYSVNLTDFSVRNDTINSSIRYSVTTDFSYTQGCIELQNNFAGVNSTSCPQFNKSAHVILGGVRAPSVPYVDGAPCASSKCQNITLTGKGVEMDVLGFSNFSSVPGCPATINASATLNQSISSNDSCITFGTSNIELDCQGFTIQYANTTQGVGINATNRSNITIRNCIVQQGNTTPIGTQGILLQGTNSSSVLNTTVNVTSTQSNALLLNGSRGITVTDGQYKSNGSHALYVFDSNNSIAQNLQLNATAADAARVELSTNDSIINVTGNSTTQIALFFQFATQSRVQNSSFMATNAVVAELIGISTQNNISGSYFTSPALLGAVALFVTGSSTGNYILNNTMYTQSNSGILVSSDNTVINRNYIVAGQSAPGINVQNSNNLIENNTVIAVSDAFSVGGTNNTLRNNTGTSTTARGFGIFSTNGVYDNNTGSAPGFPGIFVGGSNNSFNRLQGFGVQGPGIEVGANDVRLENSSGTSTTMVGILVNGTLNVTLRNNTGVGATKGIELLSANNSNVTNNTGSSAGGGNGIELNSAQNNTLIDNIGISSGGGGIFVIFSTGSNNTLVNNSGTSDTAEGFTLASSSNNTLYRNKGYSNNGSGIVIATAANNVLLENSFTSVSSRGIFVNIGTGTNITSTNGSSSSSFGIEFNGGTGNRLNLSRATSQIEGAMYLTGGTNANALANNVFQSNSAGAIEWGGNSGQNNNFTNTTLQANGTWIKIEDISTNGNTFNNTLFDTASGSIRIIGNWTLPNDKNITALSLNVSLNNSFLNSSNLTFLNQSAQIILRNLNLTSPRPLVDLNDSGVFVNCDPPRCTTLSSTVGTLIFNVTGFTTYAAALGGGLTVTKSDSVDPVVRGARFNYTITVNNTNNVSFFNVTVTESYPAGISFVSASPAPTLGNGTFALGTLAGNGTSTIHILVAVGSNVANGTILNNTANVSSQGTNGSLNAINVSELTAVQGIPTILTAKNDSPDPVARGGALGYTITVTNSGDEVAYNVSVTEGYPGATAFSNSSPAPTSGNNTFAIGNLTPGQSTTINVSLNVSSALANGSVLNNTYNVTFANLTGANGTVANSTTTTVLGAPNLSVTKSDNKDPVFAGDQVVYTIRVNNTGDDTAFNVTVIEGYPQGVSFVSSQPVPTAGNNTFVIANLAPNQSTTINITLGVGIALANGTLLTNTVNVSIQNRSGGNASFNASENTTVLASPIIAVNKTANQTTVVKGQQFNYTITVNNTGASPAFNVTVVETYPAGTAFVSAQPNPTSGNGTFNVGTLQPNQSTTINLTVTAGSNLLNGTTLNNTVNVTANRTDGRNVTQGNSTTNKVVGFPIVSVTKTGAPNPVLNGSLLTYHITVQNNGDEIAYNVTAFEGYDPNVVFISGQPTPTPGIATFPIGNLAPGQSFIINITVNTSGTYFGLVNNTVNVTFVNVSGVSLTLNATAQTTVSAAAPPFNPGGGGGGGGGGSSGVSQTQSMSGNTWTSNYLRPGDKVNFNIDKDTALHTMTVLTVLADSVNIRVASVPQEFVIKKGAVQAVDVNLDGTPDLRVSVVDIAYSKALFMLEKAAFSPAVVREPPKPLPPKAETRQPEAAPQPPVPDVLSKPQIPQEQLTNVMPQLEQKKGSSSSKFVMVAVMLVVIAGAVAGAMLFRRKGGSSGLYGGGDAMAEARKIDEALREMKLGVKESERLAKKADRLGKK